MYRFSHENINNDSSDMNVYLAKLCVKVSTMKYENIRSVKRVKR